MISITAARTRNKQLEEGKQAEGVLEDGSREEERYPEGEDGSWYLGKAKEEFHRRQGKGGSSRDEEDPIQVRVSLTWLGGISICHFSGRRIDGMQNANAKMILARKSILTGAYDYGSARTP
jgi:hypothetical protein